MKQFFYFLSMYVHPQKNFWWSESECTSLIQSLYGTRELYIYIYTYLSGTIDSRTLVFLLPTKEKRLQRDK